MSNPKTEEQKQRARERARAWYWANHDRAIATKRAYYKANRDRLVPEMRRYQAENREVLLAKQRLRSRQKAGIADATGEQPVAPCPVCLRTLPLRLDHNHETGAIRGWLCDQCNLGLGKIGDTLAAANRLVSYLIRASEGPPDSETLLQRG